MDILRILMELRRERDQLVEAITAVERLEQNGAARGRTLSDLPKRRGRPPGSKNRKPVPDYSIGQTK